MDIHFSKKKQQPVGMSIHTSIEKLKNKPERKNFGKESLNHAGYQHQDV
jgi:hypothetical protein